jgi:outer membrane protein TolC
MANPGHHLLQITALIAPLLGACSATPSGYGDGMDSWEQIERERAESGPQAIIVDGEQASDLTALLSLARVSNPGLQAAFHRWRGELERVPQATALPEPRLTFSGYLSEVETRVGPMQARVGIAQPLPWFGKRGLAGDVALEAAEAAREELEAKRLELDRSVRDTWFEYSWLEQAILITEGNRELLAHWESVARARLETGLGSHADVIRAQVELGKVEDRVQTLVDLRRPIVARLNAALDRPPGEPLPAPTSPLPEPPPLDEGMLGRALVTTSPTLRALEHRVEAAKHSIELANKAFYPDFLVGADYTFIGSASDPGVSDSGKDAVAVTLGLELPIWRSSYRSGVDEAEARMRSARFEQDDVLNRMAADLEMALYRFRDSDRRVVLYRDSLVPKGEESVQSLDTAYQSGDEGFLDLIDAQRVLLEFQLESVRAETDRAQALAEIERITGVPLHGEL